MEILFDDAGKKYDTFSSEHGDYIGLVKSRVGKILDKYMQLPESAITLAGRSFLSEKMKRYYLRIVGERIARFNRESD